MDKKTIVKNFSRYAHMYDRYSNVQRKAAFELLNMIKKDRFTKIMDLGCGTGNYTRLLREKFKKAEIKAIDISDKMIEVASDKLRDKDIEFIVKDAENINLDEKFDLITSNACFQWFKDMEKTLLKYRDMLKKDGIILFSAFGPLTFQELNFALGSILKDNSIASAGFIPLEKTKRILHDNFKETGLKEIRYEESFTSLIDLLNKIKYTGARGDGLGSKISLDRETLKEIERAYLDKFHKIKATYQVFFCHGSVE
jgi:malonyl-CoA O-methyltransferase